MKNKRKIYNVGVTITPCSSILPFPGDLITGAATYCNTHNDCEEQCKDFAKEYKQQCKIVDKGNGIVKEIKEKIYNKSNNCPPDPKWDDDLDKLIEDYQAAGKGKLEKTLAAIEKKIKKKSCIKNNEGVLDSVKKLEGQDDKIKENEKELKKQANQVKTCSNKNKPPKGKNNNPKAPNNNPKAPNKNPKAPKNNPKAPKNNPKAPKNNKKIK